MAPTGPVFLFFLLSKDFPFFVVFTVCPGFFYYFQVKILNFQVFSYIGFLQILENLENLEKPTNSIKVGKVREIPVIITPLKTYLYDQTNFWMEVICLQHLLIKYLEKYIFLKIANANFIFVDMKLIIQLSRQHFFANVK